MLNDQTVTTIKNSLKQKLEDSSNSGGLNVKKKFDKSDVTDIDLFVSELVKKLFETQNNSLNFYSEEEYTNLEFPAVILDPIDGTKELVAGIPECSVSLAVMNSSDSGEGWIYNPFTGFEVSSQDIHYPPRGHNNEHLLGLVSRSEWNAGLYSAPLPTEGISVSPKGSIAYKLGLLATGACNFVITKYPKNIWDIAAGTLICKKHDIFMFMNGQKVTKLDQQQYTQPIIWCREENYLTIKQTFL